MIGLSMPPALADVVEAAWDESHIKYSVLSVGRDCVAFTFPSRKHREDAIVLALASLRTAMVLFGEEEQS